MGIFTFPNAEKQIRQVNRGDIHGELWASFNLDLVTSPGKMKVSRRLKKVLNSAFLGGNDVVALWVHDAMYYALTTDTLWQCSVTDDPTVTANWSEEPTVAGTGGLDFGFESDMVSLGDDLLLSMGTDIAKLDPDGSLDADWWTSTISGSALTVDKPHIEHVHKGGQETFFVTDGNKIRYYNATAGHSTITLDEYFTSCCFASGVEAVWVGTYTESGTNAYVYECYVGEQIDGVPVARQGYKVDGRAVLSIDIIDGIPHIITERGHIQAFTGAGFKTVQSFPFAFKLPDVDGVQPGLVQDVSISRPIHPKGARAYDTSMYILINTKSAASGLPVDPRSPSGVWEYDSLTQNLTHRYSLTDDLSTEYGVQTLLRSGPILVTDVPETRLLLGAEVFDGTSTGIGLFSETLSYGQGYFITPEIESDAIQDTFANAVIKARTLGEDESVVLKYRVSNDPNYPFSGGIVWLNAMQFTTIDPVFADVEEGDEIEVIRGYRAGYIAHVTEKSGGPTYTITVDESLGVLNEESVVRVQNFKKLNPAYLRADGEYKKIGVPPTAPWIQYKGVLKGDVEVRRFTSKGNSKTQY